MTIIGGQGGVTQWVVPSSGTETTTTYKTEKKHPLSEEECVRIGGHCYESDGMVYTSNPPMFRRICKHCGKSQWGRQREDMEWFD